MDYKEYWFDKYNSELAKKKQIIYEMDLLKRRLETVNKTIKKYHTKYLDCVTESVVEDIFE